MKYVGRILALAVALAAANVYALPSLQLGPNAVPGSESSGWTYDTGTDTWVYSGSDPFTLRALANDDTNAAGAYPWDTAGTSQYAYLVVATVPDIGTADSFDVTVTGDDGALMLVSQGYGTPPVEDFNSLPSHGIYDTYFEIYEFSFNSATSAMYNTSPDCTGAGGDPCDPLPPSDPAKRDGWLEDLTIDILSLDPSVGGLHFDLFTIEGDKSWEPDDPTFEATCKPPSCKDSFVYKFAPFSHDVEYQVPEPGTLGLLGAGLLVLGLTARRRSNSIPA